MRLKPIEHHIALEFSMDLGGAVAGGVAKWAPIRILMCWGNKQKG